MQFQPEPTATRRRRTLVAAAVIAVLVIALVASAAAVAGYRAKDIAARHAAAAATAAPSAAPTGTPQPKPLVMTYLYYWYNANTGQHLSAKDPLPTHPTSPPVVSWDNTSWFKKQLADMNDAGVDVALPVYWGYKPDQAWSTAGLRYLAQARDEMVAAGQPAPTIGMFFDTSILDKLDLTKSQNIEYFYSNLKDFFSRVPASDWARYQGRPIVFVFLPQNGNLFGQSLFDYAYSHFQSDFNVRPYIVRATGWDCPITAWDASGPTKDCGKPIQTDASFVWGAAQDGFQAAGSVATVGPGYDESKIAGRAGKVVARGNGDWYSANFDKAIGSGKRLLAIETWNEFHEASGICESREYGRVYIDLTRKLTDLYRQRLGGTLDPQKAA